MYFDAAILPFWWSTYLWVALYYYFGPEEWDLRNKLAIYWFNMYLYHELYNKILN